MDVNEDLQGNCEYRHILILTCSDDEKEPVFACETEDDFLKWRKALKQALLDLRAWKLAYKQDIVLTDPTPKKLPIISRIPLYDQIDVEITLEDDFDEGMYQIIPYMVILYVEITLEDVFEEGMYQIIRYMLIFLLNQV